jgi:hypothetical protein
MKTGTCYFPSYGAALRYYRPYVGHPVFMGGEAHPARLKRTKDAECRALVDQKLNEGEIHIGKPALKPGQTLSIEDNRYHITEAAK